MTEAATIVQLGDPVLRKKARALTLDEIKSTEIQALIQTMCETVHGRGVGLAAVQIGYSLQIIVIEDLQDFINRIPEEICKERGRKPIPMHVLINPEIVWQDEEVDLFFEGCLSVGDDARPTPRAKQVKVTYLNEKGERQTILADGWYARILQHEIGHLNGILFIDVADARAKVTMDEYKENWMYATAADVKNFYNEKVSN